ncbi:hypothetical protein NP493_359g06032 [Ridgeia piscesae]|uniref:PHD-type domain-containing protein n=1 Tax=Ridgeia piscesae TaxID=27915 RepID=A0AAD9NVD9_RIDPI|nr:hypothetical protein NP493_359g06032 [Ridgeia piscesae]
MTPTRKRRKTGNDGLCLFCASGTDNPQKYGQKLEREDITVHYFCMLFASGLSQNGKSDKEGILGFLMRDIFCEVKRGRRLRCTYCKKTGATVGCVKSNCRRAFHFGCGRDNGALSQFFGNFRAISQFFGNFSSYCQDHCPKQVVPVRDRLSFHGTANSICAICMSAVEGTRIKQHPACAVLQERLVPSQLYAAPVHPSPCPPWHLCTHAPVHPGTCPPWHLSTLAPVHPRTCPPWHLSTLAPVHPSTCPPWHRSTPVLVELNQQLLRQAIYSGIHFFKCALCNNKDIFQDEMLTFGIYIPDQDAAWELEPNAYHDLLERHSQCDVTRCLCNQGRRYNKDNSNWEIILCDWCGSKGTHIICSAVDKSSCNDWICDECSNVASKMGSTKKSSRAKKPQIDDWLKKKLASFSRLSKGKTTKRKKPLGTDKQSHNIRKRCRTNTGAEHFRDSN